MAATEEKYPNLDYAEQLARIEHSIAEMRNLNEETRKFTAEQHRLSAETQKFGAEQQKLSEEALKFRRERSLAPLALLSGFVSGAIVATVAHFLH